MSFIRQKYLAHRIFSRTLALVAIKLLLLHNENHCLREFRLTHCNMMSKR